MCMQRGSTYEVRGGLEQALHDGTARFSGCAKDDNLHVGNANDVERDTDELRESKL